MIPQSGFSHVKTIGILGAGLAGITAAKIFLDSKERKFDITIFEAEPYLGGVWSHSYPSLCVQTVRDWFGWSWRDLSPSAGGEPDWPSAGHVTSEFNKFADDYGIRPLIRFNHRVIQLHRGKPGDKPGTERGYTVEVQHTKTKEIKKFFFDFFLIAHGRYSKKYVPDLPGQAEYTGEILHSSEYREWKQLAGKRVLVVGGGKSGLEISTEVADAKQKIILAARSVYYTPPRKIFNCLNHRYLIYMPALKYKPTFNKYRMDWGEQIIYWALRPAWFLVSYFLQIVMHLQFKLKRLTPPMLPERNFYYYFGSFDIATPGFFEALSDGKIELHRCPLTKFTGGKKVLLGDKKEVEVDIVVFCTGYSQDHDFMPEDIRKLKEEDGHRLWLYRFLLHPRLKDMGFVCQADPFSSILCSELTSRWLRALIEGKIPYPSQQEMEKRVALDRKEAEKFDDPEDASPLAIHPFEYFYYKELLQDLGVSKPPKGGDWLLEYISPCWARDFRSTFAESPPKQRNFFRYNIGAMCILLFFGFLILFVFRKLFRV